uniref:Reverse transcriptase domain-containing protein n=1 Tax=Biomphalaria glabrata TaxID=6526 RepID=A0A2C9LNM3_BIOGL
MRRADNKTCQLESRVVKVDVTLLPHRKKTSWIHPRSKLWHHQVDFIIVRQSDRQDVKVTKALCGADCWTDHRLILYKLKICIKPPRRPQECKHAKRLDVGKLKIPNIKQGLINKLDSEIKTLHMNKDVKNSWNKLRDSVYSLVSSVLGQPKRKQQDWFDENNVQIEQLLTHKQYCFKVFLCSPTCAKAENATLMPKESSSPIFSSDGNKLLTDKEDILVRWAEHFSTVLNCPSSISAEAIARLEQVPINHSLTDPPRLNKVMTAISNLSNGKAPGLDSIPAEIYSLGSSEVTAKLTEIYQIMWEQKKLPQEFKDASIHLYKRKGNRQLYDNHCGISLLCIAGKVLARVLLNRLQHHLETGLLQESQCGFMRGRGTVDMICAVRQLQEKCREQNSNFYTVFVDLTKAFDKVSREGLCQIMS